MCDPIRYNAKTAEEDFCKVTCNANSAAEYMQRNIVQGNIEISSLSYQNSKNCVYFGGFRKIEILSNKEIWYFEGQDTQSSYPVDTNIA